ncbi:MAG: redoxin family protein [Isosphaeraceae bacterium]
MRRRWVIAAVFLASIGHTGLARSDEPTRPRPPIGQRIASLEFKDIRYLARSLDDFGPRRAFVIIATRSSCPVARKYLPVLNDLEARYRDRGVQFLALDVADDEPIIEMAADAVESHLTFPIVKDVQLGSARQLGLTRTPEVAVLDGDRVLRFRGRIDDQFRVAGERPQPTSQPLVEALDAILAGHPVAIAETPVDGCLITWNTSATTDSRPVPTYAEHVAPIVQKHCQKCHRPGTEAPFALMNYRDATSQSAMLAEVVADRRMPPWYASERHGDFLNRRGLSESERDTVLRWVAGGMPKGDPSKTPARPTWPTGTWAIGQPDVVTTTPIEYKLPATGYVDYKYAVFPYLFTRDTWVQSIEILPDNPRVVHHANLAFMKLGERPREENFLTGRVPGGDPMVLDDGTAVLIPKGSVIGLQIHFTTTGRPERAKISVGLRYPRTTVHKRLYHQQVHTTRFKIPPRTAAHPVSARRTLDFDATGVGVFSHMHLRGKDMTFLAHRPDGSTETLLLIPNYNFDWQHSYRWKPGATRFPKGTTLEVQAHFDNSEFNPFNPDPSATVGNGDQTYDEMMYGFYFYTRDDEDLNLRVDPATGGAIPASSSPAAQGDPSHATNQETGLAVEHGGAGVPGSGPRREAGPRR